MAVVAVVFVVAVTVVALKVVVAVQLRNSQFWQNMTSMCMVSCWKTIGLFLSHLLEFSFQVATIEGHFVSGLRLLIGPGGDLLMYS